MRLMIDVNEDDYKALHKSVMILHGRRSGKTLESRIFAAVGNGTPFPSGADMRKDDSAIRKRAELEMAESCFLEQGITQGIV